MKLSLIITTYNSEVWLQKVLVGYSIQTEQDFEVVIADDGSNEKTKEVIDSFKNVFKYPIIHVWQEDQGFQKCKILNKAILKTTTDYLLFTDGDCIPRKDFVAQHLKHKEEGYFLSGGYFKLPMETSQKISLDIIKSQDCFSISWLIKNGVPQTFKLSKLTKVGFFAAFMNWLTPTKRTFNGHNTSCFKADLLAINGFNEEMQYGGLDREVGERLFNLGLLSKQIRYSAVCLHLDHKRGYASEEIWKKNHQIREFNRKNKIIKISKGISQY
ncbi:MAG: glycosyltransferase family 2 protein [Flavobacterium sp.]|uniref:glycosyltransferase family 2 protein n=1 Tax=Flavobacterium sp. TaxID=239 RepID=UPI003BA71360